MIYQKFLKTTLITSIVASTTILGQFVRAQESESNKFICEVSTENIPTIYANTPEGPKPVMRFASTYFPPPYTPMRRCQEITARYNKFHAQGNLQYMTTGWVKRLPVICAGQTCREDTLLITLKSDQEPDRALQEILANRSGASGPTVQSSGSGSITISVQDYLDKTPVETPGNSNSSVPTAVPSQSGGNGIY